MTKTRMLATVLGCALLAGATSPVLGASQDQQEKSNRHHSDDWRQAVVSGEGFLADHPDMLNRKRAMEELERGKPARAAVYFKRAARYADKQSQAAYAEMLWEGRGIAQDRPAAYAWMDLASERGYTLFLGFRERYWNALNKDERERALEVGEKVYASYGDDVAKPRLERVLLRAKRKITGSRVGMVGQLLEIVIPGPGGRMVVDASTYYDKRYWEPANYWQWQKEIVDGAKEGKVIVGDFRRARDKGPQKDED